MDCKLVHKNLIGYVEQTLPEVLSAEVQGHIGSCATCQKLYENVAVTYNVFDKLPQPEVNPFIYTRIEQRLKNKLYPEVRPVLIRSLKPAVTMVLIFAGITLGIFIGSSLAVTPSAPVSPDRTEVLNAYASEYYLTSTNDESTNILFNNE
jgi:predicted anti-sigma-YlaC factor YlaD